MVFSSLPFLYLFLPACIVIYFLCPTLRIKNLVLMALSLFFYAWGEPLWVILLIFSAFVDYVNALIIGKYRGLWQSRAAMLSSLIINLGLLFVFKYCGFFIENLNLIPGVHLPAAHIVMPIGISFYTFQTLSYTLDVYKDEVPIQRSFSDFLLFVSLFPQLIAGPILRYKELAAQLGYRRTTLSGFAFGITRFFCGLGKKVLIANYAGAVVAGIFSRGTDISGLSALEVWLGMLMFAFQIYFDFSGYSDMAIGLGRIFGFKYSENFNYPYSSVSITDFWRRWHISLSSFFRDYIYIPLGGNRHSHIRNMFIVWLVTGFWHGASWNFVLWGLYYFVLLTVEKYLLADVLKRLPRAVSTLYSFVFVLFGWVFFYFTSLPDVFSAFGAMFGLFGNGFFSEQALMLLKNNLFLLPLAAVFSFPIARAFASRFRLLPREGKAGKRIYFAGVAVYNTAMLLFCTASLVGESYNPFLYFRF